MLALISNQTPRAPPAAATMLSMRPLLRSRTARLRLAAKATPSMTARCMCPALWPLVRPKNSPRALAAPPLAVEIGQEQQPVRARRRRRCHRRDRLVARLVGMQRAPRPTHRVAAGVEDRESRPRAVGSTHVGDDWVFKGLRRISGDQRRSAGDVGAAMLTRDAGSQ